MHFRLDIFMEANNTSPDQTAAKEQSVLGLNCLQYSLPKNINYAGEMSRQQVMTGREGVNC